MQYMDTWPTGNIAQAEITQGRFAIVIDILRASTTIATALAHGALCVTPCAEIADARAYKQAHPDALLGGERKAVVIEGFDLGNSPLEYTPQRVRNRRIAMSTTNGTRALRAADRAKVVCVGCFANADAVIRLAKASGLDIAIVCAGTRGRFSLEDVLCAGLFVEALAKPDTVLCDFSIAARALYRLHQDHLQDAVASTKHGRTLQQAGFAYDIPPCAACNTLDVVPVMQQDGALYAVRP
nr:2-phosphosulfolactate phosphatase [Maliibacterium massiliense]